MKDTKEKMLEAIGKAFVRYTHKDNIIDISAQACADIADEQSIKFVEWILNVDFEKCQDNGKFWWEWYGEEYSTKELLQKFKEETE